MKFFTLFSHVFQYENYLLSGETKPILNFQYLNEISEFTEFPVLTDYSNPHWKNNNADLKKIYVIKSASFQL